LYAAVNEAEVTNSRILRSTSCTIEANYWQTRIIARPLCDSRSTCCSQVLLASVAQSMTVGRLKMR